MDIQVLPFHLVFLLVYWICLSEPKPDHKHLMKRPPEKSHTHTDLKKNKIALICIHAAKSTQPKPKIN